VLLLGALIPGVGGGAWSQTGAGDADTDAYRNGVAGANGAVIYYFI
jgi:hypothetical protein